MPSVPDLLSRRVRADGAAPLLTYYDLDTGERTELSATTFANWVAKTANLIVDELLLSPGDPVHLVLAEGHPSHWVTLVWHAACWQTGTVVSLDGSRDVGVVVTGPDWSAVDGGGLEVVACALHPLGLPFSRPLPAGVIDYALEVRGQPDAYAGVPVGAGSPAWRDEHRILTQADLAADPVDEPRRRLVRAGEPWPTTVEALIRPLRDGGSTVVVTGDADPARLARIGSDERVDEAD